MYRRVQCVWDKYKFIINCCILIAYRFWSPCNNLFGIIIILFNITIWFHWNINNIGYNFVHFTSLYYFPGIQKQFNWNSILCVMRESFFPIGSMTEMLSAVSTSNVIELDISKCIWWWTHEPHKTPTVIYKGNKRISHS